MCEQDLDLGSRRYRQSQSPDVVFHVRARVDHDHVSTSDEERPRSVQSERPRVPRVQDIEAFRQDASRRSAAICSASLSATPINWISSSSENAAFVSESMSI